ncbi:hypothetical protein Y032_0164g3556 [Ancylostoma ceylanicum]|uniref:Uncharacterized protein n=1 Tax=Ancylostoma ceylanicum TaxID=53326 RepID=A0A016SXK0_9BILA|nr:hypothetical protein Y032_0164g3556 [Ancylostoma ceylanicum]
MEVQRYDVTIEHVKGAANCVADALSRGIASSPDELEPTHPEDEKVVCQIIEAVEASKDIEVRLPRHERKLSSKDFVIGNDQLKLILEDGTLASVTA